jgi:hypothetical protein
MYDSSSEFSVDSFDSNHYAIVDSGANTAQRAKYIWEHSIYLNDTHCGAAQWNEHNWLDEFRWICLKCRSSETSGI